MKVMIDYYDDEVDLAKSIMNEVKKILGPLRVVKNIKYNKRVGYRNLVREDQLNTTYKPLPRQEWLRPELHVPPKKRTHSEEVFRSEEVKRERPARSCAKP